MTDIVKHLRDCENDPMWADHAEIPKAWCKRAADEIDLLREALIWCSGASDFAPDGVARAGFEKLILPLLQNK